MHLLSLGWSAVRRRSILPFHPPATTRALHSPNVSVAHVTSVPTPYQTTRFSSLSSLGLAMPLLLPRVLFAMAGCSKFPPRTLVDRPPLAKHASWLASHDVCVSVNGWLDRGRTADDLILHAQGDLMKDTLLRQQHTLVEVHMSSVIAVRFQPTAWFNRFDLVIAPSRPYAHTGKDLSINSHQIGRLYCECVYGHMCRLEGRAVPSL